MISEFIIFGAILSIIATGFFRKHNPKQTSIILAKSRKNHVVIVGYSNLGQHIQKYLDKMGIKWVIIEPNEDLVKHLINKEQAIITRKPKNLEVLVDASIQNAQLVILTENDLETLVLVSGLTRDLNKNCKIVARCFDDSIAKTLEKIFGCQTISTSRYVSEFIFEKIKKLNPKNAIIAGYTNTTKRLIKYFKELGIKYTIIEKDKNKVADVLNNEPIIVGDASDKENLTNAGIKNTDVVITLIKDAEEVILISDAVRELNKDCKLFCRFYYEDVGAVLEQPPFNAIVISKAQHTLNKLIEMGVFDFIR